jgi:hypothetical protein
MSLIKLVGLYILPTLTNNKYPQVTFRAPEKASQTLKLVRMGCEYILATSVLK